jgi:UDP-glucose 4-epimerase
VASNGRALETLGWRPRRSLSDAVRDSWAWMQANPEGYAD